MDKLNDLVEMAEKADAVANLMDAVNPHDILAIAEAFRALEQRAEAAEAQLAERANQKAAGFVNAPGKAKLFYHGESLPVDTKLYTRPVPAAVPVDLVPGNDLTRVLSFAKFVIKCVRKNGEYAPLSSQEPNEIDAILRRIEELK